MKKRVIIGLFLIVITLLFSGAINGQDGWIYDAKEVSLKLDIGSKIKVKPTSDDFKLNYISVNLTYVPYNEIDQKVNEIIYMPEITNGSKEDHFVLFEWNNPRNLDYEYKVSSNIIKENRIVKVWEKPQFPILDIPEKIKKYLRSTKLIDANDEEINQLASSLASGKDDEYKIVFDLAKFVNENIEYQENNTEVTENKKSAKGVLENKIGVCDEKTTLFIAMLRSIGIPAKYISGVSYSNFYDGNWESHAWAEVFFQKEGWIPYDVTYGEFGFVDATHIKLKETIDGNDSSVNYKWEGSNVNLVAEELDLDVEVTGKKGLVEEDVALESELFKKKIGFGSYNVLKVKVKNKKRYYISTKVKLAKTKEIEFAGESVKYLLLEPNEEKTIYFLFKVKDDLYKSYIYTIPIMAYTEKNITTNQSFFSKNGLPIFSEEDIEKQIDDEKEIENYKGSKELSLKCNTDKKEYYIFENVDYKCVAKNTGNVVIEEIKVCMDQDCRDLRFGIGQSKNIQFSKTFDKVGKQKMIVKAENPSIKKVEYDEIEIKDKVNATIEEIKYPEKARFGEMFDISFLIKRNSVSNPKNISINLKSKRIEKKWYIKELKQHQKFIVKVDSGLFYGKDAKNAVIDLKYLDENDNEYEKTENFSIEIIDVTFFQKLSIKIMDWWRSFENKVYS